MIGLWINQWTSQFLELLDKYLRHMFQWALLDTTQNNRKYYIFISPDKTLVGTWAG